MLTLRSHTHLQATQSHASAKACKRVCLPNRTNDRTTIDQEEQRRHNSVLPQLAVTCKIEAECYYQTFVLLDSEVLRNRQLRQHANR